MYFFIVDSKTSDLKNKPDSSEIRIWNAICKRTSPISSSRSESCSFSVASTNS